MFVDDVIVLWINLQVTTADPWAKRGQTVSAVLDADVSYCRVEWIVERGLSQRRSSENFVGAILSPGKVDVMLVLFHEIFERITTQNNRETFICTLSMKKIKNYQESWKTYTWVAATDSSRSQLDIPATIPTDTLPLESRRNRRRIFTILLVRDELNLHRHACFSVSAVIKWDHVVIYALGPVAVQAMHLPLEELEVLHGLVEPFDGECVLGQRNPCHKSTIMNPGQKIANIWFYWIAFRS